AAGLAKTAGTAKKLATAAAAGFLQTALSIVLLMVLNNIANSKFAAILSWAAWQLQQIAASPYCSVLLDNSTDKSLEEHCLLYVRYLDLKTMKAKTEYLCTVKLFSKTGLSLFETLKLVLGILGIDMSKVTAMFTDGDAAMTGRENGLRGHLQRLNPFLLSAHCAAHKTNLVLAAMASTHDRLDQLDKVLQKTHNYFGRSPKKYQMWKRFAEMNGLTATKVPMFNKTHWFSRKQCINFMLKSLPILILFFASRKVEQTLEGVPEMLSVLTDAEFVMVLHGAVAQVS
ncbi:hypothetical protein WJX84_010111, partial [Apatococcus fuscideae]